MNLFQALQNFMKQKFSKQAPNVPDSEFYYQAIKKDNLVRVSELLKSGANVDGTGWRGDSALCACAGDGSLEMARLLISFGANVNFCDHSKETPLHSAARGRHLEMAALLLRSGANANAQDQDSRTPLENAAFLGDLDMCNLLIEHGANVNSTNAFQKTPLHIAASEGHTNVVALLLKSGSNPNAKAYNATPFEKAVSHGHKDTAALLRTADPAAAIEYEAKLIANTTEITRAIQSKDIAKVISLLENGADPNGKHNGSPAIILAINATGTDAPKIVEILINYGADVNAKDDQGRTALDWAASVGWMSIAKTLLEKGAAVNSINGLGMTPLQGAQMQGHSEIVQLLKSCGGH